METDYKVGTINELEPELAGTSTGLANWCGTVSSPRQVMFGGQIGQAVVTACTMVRNNLTGDEREYGKYTFGKKVSKTVRVEKIIDKLPPGIGGVSAENPLRTVIVREPETMVLGVLDVPLWHSRHQSYGFKYKHTKRYEELRQKDMLMEGERLTVSPNVKEGGIWGYGCEANVAFMTTPETIEDGFCASQEFLERNRFSAVKNSVVSFGSRYVALNLYGDENNYKPFPDIGERVKDHGIIMALRRIDDRLSIVELTPKALMEVDYEFDKRIYAAPGATVVDIDVLHNVANNKVRSLVGTAEQPMRYYEMVSKYYAKLIDSYEQARREARHNHTELTLTPELHSLIVRARERTQVNNTKLVYRNAELDDFRVELTYTYDVIPTIGFKFTATHGDGSNVTATSTNVI